MKCAQCKEEIPAGEEMLWRGWTLCEDCYIKNISKPRSCDIASLMHDIKIHRELSGQTGTEGLSKLQKNIYEFVKEKGKVTPEEIRENFGLMELELDRNLAVLGHCELLEVTKINTKIYIFIMN